jgi:hypothetical protein
MGHLRLLRQQVLTAAAVAPAAAVSHAIVGHLQEIIGHLIRIEGF